MYRRSILLQNGDVILDYSSHVRKYCFTLKGTVCGLNYSSS